MEAAWEAVQQRTLLEHVTHRRLKIMRLELEPLPERFREGLYELKLYLFGFLPLGRHTIRVGSLDPLLFSFDPQFAASLGFSRLGLEVLLTSILAFAIVIGLQLVGVVLMAAIVIAPAAARQWNDSLGQMVGLAALFGALASVSGALVSASRRELATGPLIVIAASLIAPFSLLFAPERGLIAAYRTRGARRELEQQRVLLDLYGLAQGYDNPGYASESGMPGDLYGGSAAALLERLEAAGLAERTTHMQEEGTHYRLTTAGRVRAERALAALESPRA